ncbi:MAG: glycosyltransferase family 2 protein [Ignavibacteriae bacterium]|nr:glycosyltransferase family 2 protein [Ignavibacteriota bacterium]
MSYQSPLVSIIIPTFNRVHLIGETLDSILAQTYTNWECIVVDDNSTDDTETLVKGYQSKDSRIQYHKRPSNRLKGANACRNYGFELSQGAYVNWFDSDDLMVNTRLETAVNILENKSNSYGFIVDRYDNFDGFIFGKKEEAFENNKFNTINLKNYLHHKVYWGTVNLIGYRSIF